MSTENAAISNEPEPADDGALFPAALVQGERPVSAIEVAAVRHIEFLHSRGLLGPEHGLTAQLILDLSRSVGMGARAGKAAGVALAARQLMDAMALLPAPPPPAERSTWDLVVGAINGEQRPA